MGTEQFTEHLMNFHLTRQEASVYECLLENGKMTGYEVAKLTGASRSNVYMALTSLCEKGAANLVQELTGKKYLAVSIQEFCENRIDQLKKEEDWLVLHAPSVRTEEEGYITIVGEENIENKAKKLLQSTKERVYVSAGKEFLDVILPELEKISDEGKKVVVLTDCTDYQGPGKLYKALEKKKQIGMITDSRYVLSGEFGARTKNTCLYTGQQNFAEVFKDAMANEIKLIEFTKGERK